MSVKARKFCMEALEQRTLLAADVVTSLDSSNLDVRDLAAIYASAGVASESFSSGRILESLDLSSSELSDSLEISRVAIEGDLISVSVMGNGSSSELMQLVTDAGMTPTFIGGASAVVDGKIPLNDLHKLTESNGVSAVIPWRPDLATDSVGAVDNDAEIAMRAETIRDFLGLTGAGVTVGVISNGVGGLEDSQATNDLPEDFGTPGEDVTVRILDPGAGNEGTAMLELIHDIAPEANLLFHAGLGAEGPCRTILSLAA